MKPWNVLLHFLFATILIAFSNPLSAQSASDRFDDSITSLASDISSKSRQVGVIKIAVLGFSGADAQTSAFGKMIAEEITVKLFSSRKYQIFERELLVKILREQQLELNGPVDSSAAQRLGKLLAIDAILSGSITDTSVGLRINARLVSTTSGEVLSVGGVTIAKDSFVTDFMRMSFLEAGQDQRETSPSSRLDTLVKQNGFTFECKRHYTRSDRPNSIYVDVVVTNLGADRELTLGDHMLSKHGRGSTRVMSKDGNKFSVYDIFIGHQTSTQKTLLSPIRRSGIRKMFSTKQPVTVTFDFTGKNASSEIPTTLDLLTSTYGKERNEILLHLRIPQQK